MQGHFGADPFQRLHLEVGIAHPVFYRPERMLDRLAALAHLLRVLGETLLNGIQNMLVLPAGNSALLARRTLILDDTGLAGVGPVAPQHQPLFLIREAVDQALTGRATINIIGGHIDKVLLSKPALGLAARG